MAKKRIEPTEKEIREWNEIEELVLNYQSYLSSNDKEEIVNPAFELLERFSPLFKKYLSLIKHNQIDFNDM